jgi:hypothetical protein
MGLKNPWLVPACERPWHGHLEMTKLIGLIINGESGMISIPCGPNIANSPFGSAS